MILPLPDLVRGQNVITSLRNEAKAYGGYGQKPSKAKQHKENQDVPWAEQNRSIVAQTRPRLFVTVAILRIIEAAYISSILPLTAFACRVTMHCPEGIQVWQIRQLLYPAGWDGTGTLHDAFSLFQSDRLSAIITILSAFMIPSLLLLAQAVTLNGSYLAIMGYIVHNQATFKATSNPMEGHPFDVFLRKATHDLFRNELGHPSTSIILVRALEIHTMFIAVVVAVFSWRFFGKTGHIGGLFPTVLANLLACYGANKVGMADNPKLLCLSKEISLE